MNDRSSLSEFSPNRAEPQSNTELCWADAKNAANTAVFNSTKQYLSDIEINVLQGSWEGKTYDEMAEIYGYSSEYLNKDIGNKLWKKLSEVLGERVTKRNFREALRRAWSRQVIALSELNSSSDLSPISTPTGMIPATRVPFPEGSVALNSLLYLERSNVESRCCETVLRPGALIRIKAPNLMGKTSLIHRILSYTKKLDYRAVYIDLRSCDRAILTNLDKFLRWLCMRVSQQLALENRLKDHWDTEILGSNDNCTAYFEEYLLPDSDQPLVLCLDDSDRLFAYTEVAEDVLGMLRSWHEKGKVSAIWQQLRLVMAHSTEVYIPLDINQSPFNAGLPIELQEFDHDQVKALAQLHGLSLKILDIETLMEAVGGHPYLICLALYTLCNNDLTVDQLLKTASTESGIYSSHLRRHLETVQQSPELVAALKQVVTAETPVELDSMKTYKLHSMGLVQQLDNHVVPRCNLYREYFYRVLT